MFWIATDMFWTFVLKLGSLENVTQFRFALHCIHPCVPSMVVDENKPVAVSSKRKMLAWPKEIKVKNLQGS